MSPLPKSPKNRAKRRRNLWFERLMAILAVVNLGLVLFDLTYIPWRDVYLREFPVITQVYDPVKGIEPHRITQHYLSVVNELENQVIQTGLQSPETANLLQELQILSNTMVVENPFQIANKDGVLERIKNRMRGRMEQESARQAFSDFWSLDHLSSAGWQSEISFFNTRIQPLIATNYYRGVGERGGPIDYFWRIDLPFVLLFGLELLARTFYISRRHSGVSWAGAILWRWYDLFLLLPFWRWLRVIPVTIRLHQANLINLESIRQELNHEFALTFAEELTQLVVVRVIDQMQDALNQGELGQWLLSPKGPYVQVNNVNELEVIANRLMKITLYQVLPKIQPDIEALLHHSLTSALHQSPLYQGLQKVPGVKDLPNQWTQQLATDISQNAYNALIASLEDPVGAELSGRLGHNFKTALASELKQQHTLDEFQSLLADFLEEMKINYVKRLSAEDIEALWEETRHLQSLQSQPPDSSSQMVSLTRAQINQLK